MVSAVALIGIISFETAREVLESPERRENMVNTNYEIANRHYSFAVLHRHLNMLLTNFFGVNI
jgi:mannosylglucosylglycerate synthase